MVDFHSWSRWGNRKQIYLLPKIAKHLQNVWNDSSRLWVSASVSCSVVSDYMRPHRPQPPRLLHLWNSPDKKTGVGYHSLLQGIFLTQGSNLGLLHCKGFFFLPSEPPGKTLGMRQQRTVVLERKKSTNNVPLTDHIWFRKMSRSWPMEEEFP